MNDIRLSMTIHRPGRPDLDVSVSVEYEDGLVSFARGPSAPTPVRYWASEASCGWEAYLNDHWVSTASIVPFVQSTNLELRSALIAGARAGLVAMGKSVIR